MKRISFGTSRRSFIAGATLAASSLATREAARAQPTQEGDYLFVQTAKGMTFDKTTNKLVLTGISPITVFFTDRPERIAGNMKTTAFVPFWSQGKDSFKSNPPNADISVLEGNGIRQVVAELQEPMLSGDDLSYTIKILQGDIPAQGTDVSVFIDFIGVAMAGINWAGFQRQNYRRAYWNGS